MGPILHGAVGRASGLRPGVAGHGRAEPRTGGDAGHALGGEGAPRPRIRGAAARRRVHSSPAIAQRPRPICPPALPCHRRGFRGARRRSALPVRVPADARADDGRARAGPQGHRRRCPGRRPGPRPRSGRLRAPRARRASPGTAARGGGKASADRVRLRHAPPRRDHRRRPRAASSSSGSADICYARPSPTMPSRRSPTAACVSTSRPHGAAALPMPT